MTMRSTLHGKVLSFDYDAEHYRPGTGNGNQNSGSYIGEAEAKRIAWLRCLARRRIMSAE